jgi:streptogramin lyase
MNYCNRPAEGDRPVEGDQDLPAPVDICGWPDAVEIPAQPFADWITVADGCVWITGIDDGIAQFDAATGHLIRVIGLPEEVCSAIDHGFGAIWAAAAEGRRLLKIDTRSGRVTSVSVPGDAGLCESSVGVGDGWVWTLSAEANPQLARFDPQLERPPLRRALPPGATAVRAGSGSVWVTNAATGTVLRLDAGSMALLQEIVLEPGLRFLAADEGGVWVLNQTHGTVTPIDPRSGNPSAPIKVSERPISGGEISFGLGSVWVRVSDQLAVQVDPRQGRVVRRLGPAAGSGGIAAAAGAVWITAHDVNRVWRIPV